MNVNMNHPIARIGSLLAFDLSALSLKHVVALRQIAASQMQPSKSMRH